MAEPVRTDTIRAATWQLRLGELGQIAEGADDIDQCIRTILGTPRGSVPHRPDFGSDLWRYLDWPIDRARPHIVRETVDAVGRYEPRVEITRVSVELADDRSGLVVRIERRIRAGSALGETAITIEA